MLVATVEDSLLSPRSEAQRKLLTMIEEAVAFLKADPTEAQAISTAIIGGDQPYNHADSDDTPAPGMFETFA